jgi:hypothetical protein
MHGHTAAQCTKRTKQLPGLNLHGYYQETKPNATPIRFTTGMPQASVHQPLPSKQNSQPAVPPPPPRPQFPHFINSAQSGGNGPVVHEERLHRAANTDDDSLLHGDQYEAVEQRQQHSNHNTQHSTDQLESSQ